MPDEQLSKRILIAPLDWGLGHATRCIPIINELKRRNAKIFIAASGNALILLRQEFPDLIFFELASYGVRYYSFLTLFLQLPRFLQTIRKEHGQVQKIIEEQKIELVISDNRFGCWSHKVTSVFITHQVNILMPSLLRWLEPLANYFNHQWIKRFDRCWIPDEPQNPITRKLSVSGKVNTRYIGMLSRFKKTEMDKKYDLVILLSGPEPQRTIFEEKIIRQLKFSIFRMLLIRGLPGERIPLTSEIPNLTIVNHLQSADLNKVIEEAELIICRPGYSSVMDLAKLGKRAVFIPTPGQTEQEYLAGELKKNKIAFCMDQNKFKIEKAISQSKNYDGFAPVTENKLLKCALDELMYGLDKKF
jgi:uncharacterized protein (TIGR00661 family)